MVGFKLADVSSRVQMCVQVTYLMLLCHVIADVTVTSVYSFDFALKFCYLSYSSSVFLSSWHFCHCGNNECQASVPYWSSPPFLPERDYVSHILMSFLLIFDIQALWHYLCGS